MTEVRANREAYQFVGEYRRFNQRYNMVMRKYWDSSVPRYDKILETRVKQIKQGQHGFTLEDYALCRGAIVIAMSLGTDINTPNSGLTSWKPLGGMILPGEEKLHIDNTTEMAKKIKKVTKYYGADLVGICKLDLRWVYSHYVVDRSTGESRPVNIPNEIEYAIVIGIEMKLEMVSTAPSAVALAETLRVYSKLATVSASLAEFIRGLGYQAIPCINDTALSIPLAIDAGLGQHGRNGLLITPEFGPRVRLCKVLTDLPLEPDTPIDFGITRLCTNCKICAQACPPGAISFGERTAESPTKSNNPGVLKWYINPEKCWRYQTQVGTSCGICIKVCPLSRSRYR